MAGPPAPKRHPYAQWSPDARALDLVGDKWTLLIVRDLLGGPRRFVELQRMLPGISTEQLRSRLHRMVADGLLTRQRFREMPPRVEYALTERARALGPVIGALARWGYEWAWSAPRSGEALDVGAVLRASAPAVVVPSRLRGRLALIVDDRVHPLRVADGAVSADGAADGPVTATVRGRARAWVAALGPAGDPSGLTVEGDARLAGVVLDGLGAKALPGLAALGA